MDLDSIEEKEESLKTAVKKNCLLCRGRAHLGRPDNPEKDNCLRALGELRVVYRDKFNALRVADADGRDIQDAGENMRSIPRIVSECEACDREVERANRAIQKLR